jgi:release factor H-coupled RctB family protein
MPDLHPGRGIPVGACFAMAGVIYPHLVGSDIGCGARVVFTELDRISRDRLERKLRAAFADPAPVLEHVPSDQVFQAVWSEGPRGLLGLPDLPELLRALCETEPARNDLPASGSSGTDTAAATAVLGTLGGGNHFGEVSLVHEVATTPWLDGSES